MNQLDLNLLLIETGEACRKYFTPDMIKRIRDRYNGSTFYCLKASASSMCTWCGGGRKPRWVEDFLTEGGNLKALEIQL